MQRSQPRTITKAPRPHGSEDLMLSLDDCAWGPSRFSCASIENQYKYAAESDVVGLRQPPGPPGVLCNPDLPETAGQSDSLSVSR